jgi:hypothetical protein
VHLDTAGSTFGCNWSDVSCLKCMDSKTILASKPGDKALGEMQLRSQQFGVVGRQHLKAGEDPLLYSGPVPAGRSAMVTYTVLASH